MASESAPETKRLVAEVDALAQCLQQIVLSTAQLIQFHGTVKKLGIENPVRKPPNSLLSTLGRQMEQYDQICDTMEAQVQRAISGLKYQLRREDERLAAEEKKRQMDSAMLPPPVPDHASEERLEDSSTHPRNSPVAPLRRPSAVSISSLQRPQLPLKLDLSSASFRISEEEASGIYPKGIPSPVTLAPKSARPVGPNEFPPDFISAFSNPTLTSSTGDMPMPMAQSMQAAAGLGLGITMGDSFDKPIELDLDSMDIDVQGLLSGTAESTNDTNDGLFSPVLADGSQSASDRQASVGDELFGDFEVPGDLDSVPPPTDANAVPSPTSFLAQLGASSHLGDLKPGQLEGNGNGSAPSFDMSSIDFFATSGDSSMNFDMASFYSGTVSEGNGEDAGGQLPQQSS